MSEGLPAPRVRVVLINFDGGDVTLRCLDALRKTDYPADRMEVVVVDNASVDGLTWVIREQYPEVRLIESLTNEGFARGNNLALRDLTGIDLVALINNDTIPEPGWLWPLVETVTSADDIGAACPKLVLRAPAVGVQLEADADPVPELPARAVAVSGVRLDATNAWDAARFDERFQPPVETGDAEWPLARWSAAVASLWFPIEDGQPPPRRLTLRLGATREKVVTLRTPDRTQRVELGVTPRWVTVPLTPFDVINNAGGALYSGWFGGDRGFLEPDLGQYDEPADVFAWCGGAVLLRTDYLAEVGLFDPHFFLYYEDFDLSWRGRQLGWRYRYVPESIIRHEHAYSSKEGSDFFRFWVDRNRRLTLIKNAPAPVALRAAAGAFVGAGRNVVEHTLIRAKRRRPPSPHWIRHRVRQVGSFGKAVPAMVLQRHELRRKRVVDDAAIESWMLSK